MLLAVTSLAGVAAGEERYALVVSGASGGGEFADQQAKWRDGLLAVLRGPLGFPAQAITVLAERAEGDVGVANRVNVEAALTRIARSMSAQDVLLVVLIGHGSFDGVDAKFNLVGPDLDARQWNALLDAVPGRVVFVNTTSASFPFLSAISGANRVVIVATDSEAQKYQTVFPDFFAKAFEDEAADLDKDGRISIWEAFLYTSTGVKTWYEQRGQLSTERALLDDDADGVGRKAGEVTRDGSLAGRIFLDADASSAGLSNPELADLIGQRNMLEAELDALKRKREFMPPGDYQRELERIVVAIARLSRDIRSKS